MANYHVISRVVAFLLFSPEAEDTDGRFADVVVRENAKHKIQKLLGTQCTAAECRGLPRLSAQHIDSLGNDQNSKFKEWFLLSEYHSCSLIKLNHRKSEVLASANRVFADDYMRPLGWVLLQ